MDRIIMGEELSVYSTVALTLGKAKKANRDGIISRYLIISMKDEYSILAPTKRAIIFEEEIPGVIDELAQFVDTNLKDPRGGQVVSIPALMASTKANEFKKFMRFPGMMPINVKLRKGDCYANDINGNTIKDAQGNPVHTDNINVMVQIRCIRPDNNGGCKTDYVDNWSPERQLARMENRFYIHPVNTSSTAQEPPIGIQTQPAAPAPQVATQAPQPTVAPQVAPQPTAQAPF